MSMHGHHVFPCLDELGTMYINYVYIFPSSEQLNLHLGSFMTNLIREMLRVRIAKIVRDQKLTEQHK